jgi:hypothetical protein
MVFSFTFEAVTLTAFPGVRTKPPSAVSGACLQAKGRRLPQSGKRSWQLAGHGGRLKTPNWKAKETGEWRVGEYVGEHIAPAGRIALKLVQAWWIGLSGELWATDGINFPGIGRCFLERSGLVELISKLPDVFAVVKTALGICEESSG